MGQQQDSLGLTEDEVKAANAAMMGELPPEEPEKQEPEQREPEQKEPEQKEPEQKEPEQKEPEQKEPEKTPKPDPKGFEAEGLLKTVAKLRVSRREATAEAERARQEAEKARLEAEKLKESLEWVEKQAKVKGVDLSLKPGEFTQEQLDELKEKAGETGALLAAEVTKLRQQISDDPVEPEKPQDAPTEEDAAFAEVQAQAIAANEVLARQVSLAAGAMNDPKAPESIKVAAQETLDLLDKLDAEVAAESLEYYGKSPEAVNARYAEVARRFTALNEKQSSAEPEKEEAVQIPETLAAENLGTQTSEPTIMDKFEAAVNSGGDAFAILDQMTPQEQQEAYKALGILA